MSWFSQIIDGAKKMAYTDWTWILVGIQILIVEIIALVRGDPPLTASMRSGDMRWMLWPALFGTFTGHFFGTRIVQAGWAPSILIGLGVAVLYRDFVMRTVVPSFSHSEIFLFFYVLGAALFGMKP